MVAPVDSDINWMPSPQGCCSFRQQHHFVSGFQSNEKIAFASITLQPCRLFNKFFLIRLLHGLSKIEENQSNWSSNTKIMKWHTRFPNDPMPLSTTPPPPLQPRSNEISLPICNRMILNEFTQPNSTRNQSRWQSKGWQIQFYCFFVASKWGWVVFLSLSLSCSTSVSLSRSFSF